MASAAGSANNSNKGRLCRLQEARHEALQLQNTSRVPHEWVYRLSNVREEGWGEADRCLHSATSKHHICCANCSPAPGLKRANTTPLR